VPIAKDESNQQALTENSIIPLQKKNLFYILDLALKEKEYVQRIQI